MTKQAPIAASAAVAIGSNGFRVLRMPKYASVITVTRITEYGNGFGRVEWLDKDGAQVAETIGCTWLADEDHIPRIGRVEIIHRHDHEHKHE